MSPQTNTPKMIEVRTSLPPQFLEQMQEIADADGWKDAEFIRLCIVLGFHAYSSGSNSVLVNKKVRTRLKKWEESGELADDKE
ncbi:hypothetical protein IQ268_09035 [Oculatella sp. LEGE 06141]|nr:hypothetical protein [Oculatella sp. LEGE 06141]MBE9178703.1 hypothetical protein [Oculatella sp. LEGE 06141]